MLSLQKIPLIGNLFMNIDEFENLLHKCRITLDQDNHVSFEPFSSKYSKQIDKIIKDNQMENLMLTDFQALVTSLQPLYQARQKLKKQKAEKISGMTPQQVADLPLEQKLDYLEVLFPGTLTKEQLMEVCKKNEANIKACLYNMPFPKSFWDNEKKSADRFVSLIANQPEITEKVKNWQDTTLEEKKLVITQAGQVFKYVYGVSPDIAFFTPEQEKAKKRAQGLNEDAHVNAAYFSNGQIHFNEERLQNSDNFFAISVLFHEGTHLRQSCVSFDDDLVDRIFDCHTSFTNIYEDELNNKETADYKDLYAMQPDEVHAHRLQNYVEQQLTEKTRIEKTNFTDLDKEIKKFIIKHLQWLLFLSINHLKNKSAFHFYTFF